MLPAAAIAATTPTGAPPIAPAPTHVALDEPRTTEPGDAEARVIPSATGALADPVVELARRLTTPVDVAALVADGVLLPRRRWARRWYQVLDVVRLPEWARCRIVAMHADPDGPLVRFARPNPAVKRLLEELTGERPPQP